MLLALGLGCVALSPLLAWTAPGEGPRHISGIYPHLAVYNDGAECGIGAVAPWANRLWLITYPPHMPSGSDDKLYEIQPNLIRIRARPESIGGTHAGRFIHRETRQLFIGPYVIDARGMVRVIPPERMFGRLTGVARHLTDPAGKVYVATMEEGFYEVDVGSLGVTRLWSDEQAPEGPYADLPGYHGKGLASGQGRLVYANNGEHGQEALVDPAIPSGVLAEWDGRSPSWRAVRRNQFTEVTGPGGIRGNAHPDRDPIWSIGWDHRSLILMVLDGGKWHTYRLPKASHCYDGAHGWNTEWPRIREIGERDLLMTMHGTFWRFPRAFRPGRSSGIAPRSTYLKVIADFCRWGDRIVFGCDDTAVNEFLNKRKAKGGIAGPGQSQSNLWFVEPAKIDRLGPAIGRGAVWIDEDVKAGAPSDPFLFQGYDRRGLHLTHSSAASVTFRLEIDRRGDGRWDHLRDVVVPPQGYEWVRFTGEDRGAWVRIAASVDCAGVSAVFHFSNADRRSAEPDGIFRGLAKADETSTTGGLIRAKGERSGLLQLAATAAHQGPPASGGYYEMGADLRLQRVSDDDAERWMRTNVAVPRDGISMDAASVVYVDDSGRRWRLPVGDPELTTDGPLGAGRIDREVCTERDLFHVAGTFFELPAENARGFAGIRPIATHGLRIHDYCSWRGMLALTGLTTDATPSNHVVVSDDGRAAVWLGVVDDLWRLGKPRGTGGPWKDTKVRGGEASDPYLMTGYDRKTLTLSHLGGQNIRVSVEVDLTWTGLWRTWRVLQISPGTPTEYRFPEGYGAYWVRLRADADAVVTGRFRYD